MEKDAQEQYNIYMTMRYLKEQRFVNGQWITWYQYTPVKPKQPKVQIDKKYEDLYT